MGSFYKTKSIANALHECGLWGAKAPIWDCFGIREHKQTYNKINNALCCKKEKHLLQYTIIHLDHTLSPSRIPAHLRLPDTFCSLHTLRAFHALRAFHPSGFLTTSNAGRHLRQLFARRQVGKRVEYNVCPITYKHEVVVCRRLQRRKKHLQPAVFRKFQEVQLVTCSPS